jgi:hypothetical protein
MSHQPTQGLMNFKRFYTGGWTPQSISGQRLAIDESGHEVEVELLSLIEKCVPATVGA